MELKELNRLIVQWAVDREIVKYSNPLAQAIKTAEEVMELDRAARVWGNEMDSYFYGIGIVNHEAAKDGICDAIGDIYVTLVVGHACSQSCDDELSPSLYGFVPDAEDNIDVLPRRLVRLAGAAARHELAPAYYLTSALYFITTLEALAKQYETTLEDCVEQAYEEIKDRKGRLLPNGIFVKDS